MRYLLSTSAVACFLHIVNATCTVCGRNQNSFFDGPLNIPQVTDFYAEGDPFECLADRPSWTERARSFLGRLGLREDENNCYTLDTKQFHGSTALREFLRVQTSFAERILGDANAGPSTYETRTEIARTVCKIWTVRGLYSFKNDSRDWFLLPFGVNGSNLVIELYDVGKNASRSVPVPSNQSDVCERSFSCAQFKQLDFVPDVPKGSLSVFGNLSKQDLAATKIAQSTLETLSENLRLSRQAITPSNIAILLFACVGALFPISFVNMPDIATVLLALITDVLAPFPLAIRSVELMIAESSRRVSPAYMTTWDWRGIENGVFETWFSKCQIGLSTSITGIILFILALWFMVAGLYADFLVWRMLRKREESEGGAWRLANSTYGRSYRSSHSSVRTRRRVAIGSNETSIRSTLLASLHRSRMQRVSRSALRVYLRRFFEAFLVPKRWGLFRCFILLVIWICCGPARFAGGNLTEFAATFSFIYLHLRISGMDFTGIRLVRTNCCTINKNVMIELLTLVTAICMMTLVLVFGIMWHVACSVYVAIGFVTFVILPIRGGWRLSLMPFFTGILFGPLCYFFRKCWPESYGFVRLEKHVRGALCTGFAAWCMILWFISPFFLFLNLEKSWDFIYSGSDLDL